MTQPAAESFPCRNCGAKLQYDAASQAMACPYCGFKEAIAATAPAGDVLAGAASGTSGTSATSATSATSITSAVREVPLEEGMRLAQRGLGAPVTTIQCRECGATVHVGAGERTTSCAFCGSKEVLSQDSAEQPIRPESLLPFRVSKEEANGRFAAWLAKRWLRPNDLKRMAKVQEMGGVYVPFWTFDAEVTSRWTAERGWHYYVTERYTETVNGQTVSRTRQVQHTRWEPASGWRRDPFDDVLVCAGKGLPDALVDRLSTFDTKQLVPYRPEYLAGWRAEAYAIDLPDGWQRAQQKIARAQEGRCAGDVGGDTHRSLHVANEYARTTFKHVLLPVWIAAYRYNGKPYRFLVNGQTGEVVGVAPWSFWKIALLVLAIVAVIGAIAALASSQSGDAPAPASPAPTSIVTAPTSAPPPTSPSATPPPNLAAPPAKHPASRPHAAPKP